MPLVELEPGQFKADFNRRPFPIKHDLASHPAFTLEKLVELARKLPPEQVEYNAGNVGITQDPTKTPQTGLSIEETIRRINEAKSWMVLKRVEVDPVYKRALDDCLDQIAPLARGMRTRRAFIFISSPGSITPYHIDHEYNFLLQLRGTKQMTIIDSSVLEEEALERFYRGEHRNLVFDDAHAARGKTFDLRPGDGVHVPVNAPHYVVNGPLPSVSFSITFRTPAGDRKLAVYRVNDRLRRLGISPRPVGKTPIVDRAKYLGFALYERAQRALGRS